MQGNGAGGPRPSGGSGQRSEANTRALARSGAARSRKGCEDDSTRVAIDDEGRGRLAHRVAIAEFVAHLQTTSTIGRVPSGSFCPAQLGQSGALGS